jgi:DNA-binding XRE family transcriptional regulator
MKQGGRPRREDERPDSAFGELLKEHIRRVKDYTQAALAKEIPMQEKTLSEMVKGKRSKEGTTLRRDLRLIIRALHKRGALLTLDEANRLMTSIPTVKELDVRDPEDAEIIALFEKPVTENEREPEAAYSEPELASSHVTTPVNEPALASLQAPASPAGQAVLDETSPQPEVIPPPTRPSPPAEMLARMGRQAQLRPWWYAGLVALALLVILAAVLVMVRPWGSCSPNPHEVTLYTNIDFQGSCHSFGPGDYELARFGLDQQVSSIKDPHAAYHIALYDKAKNFFYVDKDMPVIPAEWDKRADTMEIEKHRPTSCHPGTNGIIAFLNPDYSGGCLFITGDIPDLAPLNFDGVIVSLQFVGSYQESKQLVIYRRPNYQDECGAYWQDQSDLLQCARLALSVRVLPFTPPSPIPTVPGTRAAGNVAPRAILSPPGAGAVVDGSVQTQWIGGHMVGLELKWPFPVTIHRVVVWDRRQSDTDNNQINKLELIFSDGTATGSIDMISGGPRCADSTFPARTVTWLQIIPVDASGTNGFREVEVWATTGPQYSNNTCVNKVMVAQTVLQPGIRRLDNRAVIAGEIPLDGLARLYDMMW